MHRSIHAPSRTPGSSSGLHKALAKRLSALPFLALALLVVRLVREHGYTDVRLLGRRHNRGRRYAGGADLSASTASKFGSVRMLIQIKRVATPVAQRSIDEFRGVLLRRGIPEGLIVTTSAFAKPALRAAHAYPGRPVRLLDGGTLVQMLIDARLGIIQTHDILTGESVSVIDEHAFQRLEAEADSMQAIS